MLIIFNGACDKEICEFITTLACYSFTSIATNRTWGITIMDEKTQLACGKMRSEQLCLGYAYLCEQCKLAAASHDNEASICI